MQSSWREALVLVAICACAPDCGDDETSAPTPTALTENVGPHDVSILYPLPAQASQRTSLLGADEGGARGALLPKAIYLELPTVDAVFTNEKSYSLLRVVSVRFDPCFPGLVASESDCKNQIRMVMQPVLPSTGGDFLVANDCAVHLFYELSRDEWTSTVSAVVELRKASGLTADEGPLSAHPALATEGVEGAFATGLRKVLLAHAGEQNLTRVTFMALEPLGAKWHFGGFDREGGELVPITIPETSATAQVFANTDSSGTAFEDAAISPKSTTPDDLTLLLNAASASAADEPTRLSAYDATLRIENPELNSPDTIDCASCHVAMAARVWAESAWGYAATDRPDAFQSEEGALPEGATVKQTTELRAFGHLGRRTSVSQRTVNETAAVVSYVNANVVTHEP